MTTNKKNEQLKKIRIAFWINFPILVISIIVVFNSIDTQIMWKVVASSIVFLASLSLTLLVFRQLIRLQKVDE